MSYQKSYQDLRSELRKTNKPLMEKRRRARINVCLTQLKSLVLDAMRKDTSRYSKLEKADVLEMTVKHLKSLQKQQIQVAATTDPTVAVKYRAGYAECASQVVNYLGQTDEIDPQIRARLVHHLTNRIQSTPCGPTTNYHPSGDAGNHGPRLLPGNVLHQSNALPQNNGQIIQVFPLTAVSIATGNDYVAMTTTRPAETVAMVTRAETVAMTTRGVSDTVALTTTNDVAMATREMQPLDLSMDFRNTAGYNSNNGKPTSVLWRPW